MANVTFIDVRRLQADADTADVALAMDEDAFRSFYDRTSGALWGYLSRISGDRQVADDLLQESYYRLPARCRSSEAHRRNYLYRIATNLVRTRSAARGRCSTPASRWPTCPRRKATSIPRARGRPPRLRPTQAARAPRCSETRLRARLVAQRIADVLGLKTGGIKLLLFRARRKLAAALQRQVTT